MEALARTEDPLAGQSPIPHLTFSSQGKAALVARPRPHSAQKRMEPLLFFDFSPDISNTMISQPGRLLFT